MRRARAFRLRPNNKLGGSIYLMKITSAILVTVIAVSARGQSEVIKPGAPLPSECNPRPGTMTLDSSTASSDAPGAVIGTVVDDRWRPIGSTLVRLASDPSRRTSTSDSGRFRLTNIAPGPWQLEFLGIVRVRLLAHLRSTPGAVQHVTVMLRTARLDDPCPP